jgi:DNA helicase HerA-like ATPase
VKIAFKPNLKDHKMEQQTNGQAAVEDQNRISFDEKLEQDLKKAKPAIQVPNDGRVGVTMFDAGSSKDNLITVVVPKKDLAKVPSQSLVRIESAETADGGDDRTYQGIVVQGPFYEPDGLRGDSSVIITTAANGVTFMPKYHGRVIVEILHEMVDNAALPPRFRPLPNSPVFTLTPDEAKEALQLDGDITLGTAIGHKDMEVNIPSAKKSVLPRHVGILGTTGGGKSTTVSGMVAHFQKVNIATILVDTEGEYTHINQPTEDKNMLAALDRRGLQAAGVENTQILHLIGRDTTNNEHRIKKTFSLHFDSLSPYAVMEILDLNPAQQDRYLKAYEIARTLLSKLKIYPSNEEEKNKILELDELETGYPSLKLQTIYDVIMLCQKKVSKEKLLDEKGQPLIILKSNLTGYEKEAIQAVEAESELSHKFSWMALQGIISRFLRLGIFDRPSATFSFEELTKPGQVSIIDLSDTDSPAIRNLVIASLLKGLMEYQSEHYKRVQEGKEEQRKVMLILEEAHEFLSAQRIKQMPTLYEQVARIARRGRKRWLGLTFVTQLPQHLPDEVLALINNFILHKISDAGVISRLKRSIGSIDESMWGKLNSLSYGQAVVAFAHMRRAMLTAIDPTPCKLLMVD